MKYTMISMAIVPVFALAVFAQQTGSDLPTVSLTVQVENGTKNGTPVTGDPVALEIYHHNEIIQALESAADADGKAVFENIHAGDHVFALAHAKHHNMMFHSTPVALNQQTKTQTAIVHVFEVSQDLSALSVEVHHLIITLQDNSLEITESLRLTNASDTAVTSPKKDDSKRPIVLHFSLPAGFTNLKPLSFFNSQALVETSGGFYDTMAIPPGVFDLSFSYELPVIDSSVHIEKTVSLPTENLVLFTRIGTLTLEGLGTPEKQFSNDQGIQTQYYKKTNLKPSDTLTCTITGFNSNPSGTIPWIITSAAFGFLLLFVMVRLLSKPKPELIQ